MREFKTGATRNDDEGKLDFDGFLSPLALEAFAKYMHTHRTQADGKLRDSDNWQKGMPVEQYRKSAWRHFFDVWKLSRGIDVEGVELVEALCALMFNIQGLLHEELKIRAERVKLDGKIRLRGSMAMDDIIADLTPIAGIDFASNPLDRSTLSLSAAGTTLSELDSDKINAAAAALPKPKKRINKKSDLLGPGETLDGVPYYEQVKL